MQYFRRHIFRKLARFLVLGVLLSNTSLVLASVAAAMQDQGDTSSAPCHMQSMGQKQATGSCCPDSNDCMSYCMTVSHATVFVIPSVIQFQPANLDDSVFSLTRIPDGISSELLYRPPILSI